MYVYVYVCESVVFGLSVSASTLQSTAQLTARLQHVQYLADAGVGRENVITFDTADAALVQGLEQLLQKVHLRQLGIPALKTKHVFFWNVFSWQSLF